MSTRIAITGSTGFIGNYFVSNNTRYSILEIDLLKHDLNEISFEGVDSVLHLAAIAHQKSVKDEIIYYKVNCDLAFEVAKKAKSQGVKQFIFMSTVKVYGESTNISEPWNEESLCNPADAYGKSKLKAETIIRELKDASFKVAIVRSPMVYGPGVKANMYNLVRLINKIGFIPLGGINNHRSFIFIGNLVAYFEKIIDLNLRGIFIPSDSSSLSTTQLCLIISKSLGKRVVFIRIPSQIQKLIKVLKPSFYNKLFGSLEVDTSKTNAILNYSPPYTTDEGIKAMVDWFVKTNSK
ncbi:MAG: NAD-dependent epimerase/dehydratase family protein [Tenuifilaceae bacterium]